MATVDVTKIGGGKAGSAELDPVVFETLVKTHLFHAEVRRQLAARRAGTHATKNRSAVSGGGAKPYRQKGTGNARRGAAGANLMRKGGQTFAKKPKSWRLRMPDKMRRLANRNALLAKAIDGEIKLLDRFTFDKPSTRQFAALLEALKIDRTCLVALSATQGAEAQSAANLDNVSLIRVDQLNAFDLLNHRFLLVEKDVLAAWIDRAPAPRRPDDDEEGD